MMLNVLAAWVWMGGILPAYQARRDAGMDQILALVSGFFWPVDAGRALARMVYQLVKSL